MDTHKDAKKEPITVEVLTKLYESTIKKGGSLNDIRLMCFCIWGYSVFCVTMHETSALRVCDITFERTHMKIFIEKSKTDQYRDGNWLFVANGDTDLCPAKIVRMYLSKCGIKGDDHCY